MRTKTAFLAFLLALIAASPAFAWGSKGHQYVGAIADGLLLHTKAGTQAQIILGYSLATAAKWADCVRSVQEISPGVFKFTIDPSHPEYTAPCTAFETPDEEARMEDYARRNWDNCPHRPKHGCHEEYHFADVDIEHSDYRRSYAGTSDHDIVSAINAAILVMQGKPAPQPFSIKDKKEALLLIAHFVGDMHQPLHVGAIYLDASGNKVDAEGQGVDLDKTGTAGGNFILDGSTNLHSEWDAIPDSLGAKPTKAILAGARAVPNTAGPIDQLAANWASDTVVESHDAYAGMSYVPAGFHKWTASFADRSKYLTDKARLQEQQVERAGKRLAELLKRLLP